MPEPERILRMRTVLQRIGLSRSTIYRKMKEGTFPSQVRLSEHCSGWRESEIIRWIADPMHYGGAECKRGNASDAGKAEPGHHTRSVC